MNITITITITYRFLGKMGHSRAMASQLDHRFAGISSHFILVSAHRTTCCQQILRFTGIHGSLRTQFVQLQGIDPIDEIYELQYRAVHSLVLTLDCHKGFFFFFTKLVPNIDGLLMVMQRGMKAVPLTWRAAQSRDSPWQTRSRPPPR